MTTVRATEFQTCSETILLPFRAPARTFAWHCLLAPLVVIACLWMHAQNQALEQRVDRDVAAWAALGR